MDLKNFIAKNKTILIYIAGGVVVAGVASAAILFTNSGTLYKGELDLGIKQVFCTASPNPADGDQEITITATADGYTPTSWSWSSDKSGYLGGGNPFKTSYPAGSGTVTFSVSGITKYPNGDIMDNYSASCTVSIKSFVQTLPSGVIKSVIPAPTSPIPQGTPSVSCSASPNPAIVGQQVTWTATPKNVPSGTTPGYYWSGDVTGSTAQVKKTYNTPDTYTAQVEASIGDDYITTCGVEVKAALPPPPPPPTISCSASPSPAVVGQQVSWTAKLQNSFADPSTTTFQWNQDASGAGTGVQAKKTYDTSGQKTATVSVTLDNIPIQSQPCTVMVNSQMPPAVCTTGQTQSQACASGYTGNQTQTCNTNGSWGTWNTSQCVPVQTGVCTAGQTQSQACASGYTGNRTQTCNTNGSWGTWNTSQCVPAQAGECTPGNTKSQTCPDNVTVQTSVCSSGSTWGAWSPSQCPAVTTTTTTETSETPGNATTTTTTTTATHAAATAPVPAAPPEPSKCPGVNYPKDIKGNWAEEIIKQAYDLCLVRGYEDGTFRPDQPVTRAEAVKMVLAAAGIPPIQGCYDSDCGSPFADLEMWQGQWLRAAWDLQIVKGVGPGRFAPNRGMSRAEASVVVANAFKIPAFQGCYTANCGAGHPNNFFLDITEKWQGPYVRALYDKGLVTGPFPNKFEPNRPINRAELTKLILKGKEMAK